VYTTRPPPDWKFTWDHVKHQEMHYGDGFQKEAIKEAKRQAEKEGFFQYQSPLGKGFSFANDPEEDHNPYSKQTPQGPPKIIFEYEEGVMSDSTSGKVHVTRREKIVQEMQARRTVRRKEQAQQQQQQQRFYSYPRGAAAQKAEMLYNNTSRKANNECVIL
jgi:hypothetical protein